MNASERKQIRMAEMLLHTDYAYEDVLAILQRLGGPRTKAEQKWLDRKIKEEEDPI